MASHARRRYLRPRHAGPRSSALRRRRAARRPTRTGLLALLAVGAFIIVTGASAHAEPTPTELEAQIDQAWLRLEPVIEKHNETRAELARNRAKSEALARQIAPLALQVDLALSRVGEMATQAYKGGNASAFNALLTSGSPTKLADQLSMLDQVARLQQAEISNVADLRAEYERQKKPLDDLVASLAKTEAQQALVAKEIDAEIKRLQAMRLRVYGTTGGVGELRPVPCPISYPGGGAGIAVNFACAQIGKMYEWGSAGPNTFDCSGLTMVAWAKAGVQLSHGSRDQYRQTMRVTRSQLRAGDLVFYYSDLHHVAMYVGGDWIVHASQTGVPIKMRKIDMVTPAGYGRPG